MLNIELYFFLFPAKQYENHRHTDISTNSYRCIHSMAQARSEWSDL